MSIIPVVGRKSPRMRIAIWTLYIVLILGAITTIYPFLLMLATSITNGVDVNEYRIVPRYLHDNNALFCKYEDEKYAGNLDTINGRLRTDFMKLENVTGPKDIPEKNPGEKKFVQDWLAFTKTLPIMDKEACFKGFQGGPSRLIENYRPYLERKFHGDINALNKAYIEENPGFETITIAPFEQITQPAWYPDNTTKMKDWATYKGMLSDEFLSVVGAEPLWLQFLRDDVYNSKIADLNKAYGTNYARFEDITIPKKLPTNPAEKADWEKFIRTKMPYRYMLVDESGRKAYVGMLQAKYGTIQNVNTAYNTNFASFADVKIPNWLPSGGPQLLDYMDYVAKTMPITSVTANDPENQFRNFLVKKYGSIGGINQAYGKSFTNVMAIQPPVMEADWYQMTTRVKWMRKYFVLSNYRQVVNYITVHGRALVNTIILCLAVVLTNLLVNPLCAYALSRFNLSYSNKVLLFLLATMAFPSAVAMIPNFLLLKQFHMLNTFWALILPGMANGFSIFLLKGFFDSLPRELYEAGLLDGATEMRMFWQIAIPLSKPIFAVIALNAFTAAYSGWLWALVVCQDQKMWTLMVWLYEMQTWAPSYVVLAALTVTAIPTLLIFIFCQNIIMQGIILPTEG